MADVKAAAQDAAAQPRSDGEKNGATVCVALKYPPGLILQYFEKVDENEATPLGFRSAPAQRRVGHPVTLRGNAQIAQLQRSGLIVDTGGYAITREVPRDLWRQWEAYNKHSDLVQNGLIFARDSEAECVTEAVRRGDVRSGLEPIDPANPGLTTGMRAARLQGGAVTGVESGLR